MQEGEYWKDRSSTTPFKFYLREQPASRVLSFLLLHNFRMTFVFDNLWRLLVRFLNTFRLLFVDQTLIDFWISSWFLHWHSIECHEYQQKTIEEIQKSIEVWSTNSNLKVLRNLTRRRHKLSKTNVSQNLEKTSLTSQPAHWQHVSSTL